MSAAFINALRARLKADPAVAAASRSVDWVKRPERKGYPATVLQIVSELRPQNMGGWQHRSARVQFDTLALSAGDKAALTEAVIAVIGTRGVTDGVRFARATEISFSDESEQLETEFIHRDRIVALIWYKLEN